MRKILFMVLFLLSSFVYSKEIVLKSKKVICEECVESDSLTLKVNTETKDCAVYFNDSVVHFKRNKIENVIDSENQIYQSNWIDDNITFIIVVMDEDGNIVLYEIFFDGKKLLVEF